MAIRVIDDSKLQDIAVAIQGKDGGGTMTVDQMPTRIAEILTEKKDVNFYDWEGTLLFCYSVEEVQAMTSLPAPSTLPAYATADHELLLFQEWNWSLANIKAWIQSHEGETLGVGAIYTTTDGQDHNFWNNSRLDTANTISMQKRGTTSIGYFVFLNCHPLTRINIPDGVTTINYSAFSNCYSLTHINIPDGVTYIDGYAFSSCHSLTQINIPDSVTYIGSNAFSGCHSLTQINIPDGVTTINGYAFSSCHSLTQINIPDSVTYIGNNAFSNCYSLTRINIPDGVTTIDYSAFSNCYSLTRINIPDGVTTIDYSAFSNCYSLTQINIPNGVTSIENSAFNGCEALCDILLESKPTLANTNAFSGLTTNYRIYVPRADLSWFETATNWSTIYTQSHIVAIEDYITYLESIGFDVDKYKETA